MAVIQVESTKRSGTTGFPFSSVGTDCGGSVILYSPSYFQVTTGSAWMFFSTRGGVQATAAPLSNHLKIYVTATLRIPIRYSFGETHRSKMAIFLGGGCMVFCRSYKREGKVTIRAYDVPHIVVRRVANRMRVVERASGAFNVDANRWLIWSRC